MDMALENDIPFLLAIPKELPIHENMDESTFNALMEIGYLQEYEGKRILLQKYLKS